VPGRLLRNESCTQRNSVSRKLTVGPNLALVLAAAKESSIHHTKNLPVCPNRGLFLDCGVLYSLEEVALEGACFALLEGRLWIPNLRGLAESIDIKLVCSRGTVDILRVAFSKRLIRSGRTTGPLIISVAEPEQANSLIDVGLI
jgi:hypothetical protein